MLRRLNAAQFPKFSKEPFHVTLIQPGRLLDKDYDFAFGPLARFDHANANVGTFVAMHEHVNDEIFSYMWKGEMIHEDSIGQKVQISDQKLMLMSAGESFFHEESVPEKDVEMLQIFIRPYKADLTPEVHFYDRPAINFNEWNMIGGPEHSNAPLHIRNDVYIFDIHLQTNDVVKVPGLEGYTPLLYVMDGDILLDNTHFQKKDLVTNLDKNLEQITSQSNSTVVLFLVNLQAKEITTGLFSGIQH